MLKTLVVHAYDWTVEQNGFQNQNDPDDEPSHVEICAWCLDQNSQSHLLRFNTFPYTAFIEIPKSINGISTGYSSICNIKDYFEENLQVSGWYGDTPASMIRQDIYGFYKNGKKIMLEAKFPNEKALNYCKNRLNKPIYIKSLASKVEFKIWETKISIVTKLLTKTDCKISSWFEIKGTKCSSNEELNKVSTLENEYIVDWTTMKPRTDIEVLTHPKLLAFDIETYSDRDTIFPDKYNIKHCCFMISCLYQQVGIPETKKEYVIVYGECNPIQDVEIIKVSNEVDLIYQFCNLIKHLDPELIIGYNIMKFDIPYLDVRLRSRMLKWLDCGRIIGRNSYVKTSTWESSAYGTQIINHLVMEGRVILDLYTLVSRDYKLPKYDLNTVGNFFLGRGKHDVKAPEMFRAFREQDIELMTRVTAYCAEDSRLLIDLVEKLNTWIVLVEVSSIVSVSIGDLYTRGQGLRAISQIYPYSYNLGYVITKKQQEAIPFSGGQVSAVPGLHENVIAIDAASMYPSNIMAKNLCLTTFVFEDSEGISDDDCHILEFEEDGVMIRERVVKKEVRDGIIPTIQRGLVSKRSEIRKKLDGVRGSDDEWIIAPEKDPVKKIILDTRQLEIKKCANSLFGFLSAPNGKLPLLRLGRCITAIGRRNINIVANTIIERYGAKLAYGDTDSVFMDLGISDRKRAFEMGAIIAKEASDLFPEPEIRFEFEKCMRILVMKKKRYAGFFVDKNGNFKLDKDGGYYMFARGIVLQRRDSTKYLRDLYARCLRMILTEATIFEVFEIILQHIERLLNDQVELKELTTTRLVGANYKADNFYVKVFIDELKKVGKPVEVNERIEFVVVECETDILGKKLRTLEWFYEAEEKIDKMYYIQSLVKPIDQVFSIGFMKPLVAYQGMGLAVKKKIIGIDQPVNLIIKCLENGITIGGIRKWVNRNIKRQRKLNFCKK